MREASWRRYHLNCVLEKKREEFESGKKVCGGKSRHAWGNNRSGPAQAMFRGRWIQRDWPQPAILAVNRVPWVQTSTVCRKTIFVLCSLSTPGNHLGCFPKLLILHLLDQSGNWGEGMRSRVWHRNSFPMLTLDCVDGLTEETLKSKYTLYACVFFLQEDRK